MKKIIQVFLIGILAGVVTVASAQVRFDVGLKGGLNFAKINGNSSVTANYGARTGYHGGAYAMIKIAKFAIQPEVIFSKQGQTFDYSRQNYNTVFSYVNIPIMLKLYLAAGFNLQAGPQFGFLTKATGDVIDSNGKPETGQDLKNLVKSSDVSIGFGFGWDLPLGISIGARYNLELSDINKITGQQAPSQVSSMGTISARNQVIQLSIGYRLFKLGK